MSELRERTWIEARQLLGPRTVALLPLGSLEAHGPHLPLGTDTIVAIALARRAAQRLGEAGLEAVVLPALPYGLSNDVSGLAGRVSLRPGTLWALIEDVAISLEQQGLRHLVLANGHLEPAHVEVLRGVALDRSEACTDRLQIVFSDPQGAELRAALGRPLSADDCHGGRLETGLVLAADPEAVREDERVRLAPLELPLQERLRAGARNLVEAGAPGAWCGDPAAASAGEGHAQLERLAGALIACLRAAAPDLFAA